MERPTEENTVPGTRMYEFNKYIDHIEAENKKWDEYNTLLIKEKKELKEQNQKLREDIKRYIETEGLKENCKSWEEHEKLGLKLLNK